MEGAGHRIWTLLSGPCSLSDMVRAISEACEIAEDDLSESIAAFIGELDRIGLVSRVD